jgi:hypothetical protein
MNQRIDQRRVVGRFSLESTALVFARLRLNNDRLELSGWSWSGHFVRQIPRCQISQALPLGSGKLFLWLSDGEMLRLRISDRQVLDAITASTPTRADARSGEDRAGVPRRKRLGRLRLVHSPIRPVRHSRRRQHAGLSADAWGLLSGDGTPGAPSGHVWHRLQA